MNSFLKSKSNARLFFEELSNQTKPYDFLANIPSTLPSDPFFEEEWIDFKGCPSDDTHAKKIWSKALSGYANTIDGLVVWGIDARKAPPRGIDAASGLRLLSDAHAFESRLRDWIRDATNPPVMGVEYQSYANESGEGFVVCLIPESIHKPHRAEYAEQQYYFRVGDDFLVTPPSLLRTLFYPQNFPYLWFEVELHHQFSPSDLGANYRRNPTSTDAYNYLVNKGDSSLSFNVHLHNTGSATAKEVYIVVLVNHNLSYNPGVDWRLNEHPDGQAAFLAKRSIHPGEISHLFYGTFQQTFRNVSINPSNSWELFPNFDTINLRFHVYADNFQQEEIMLEFQPSDLSFKDGFVQKIGKPIV